MSKPFDYDEGYRHGLRLGIAAAQGAARGTNDASAKNTAALIELALKEMLDRSFEPVTAQAVKS